MASSCTQGGQVLLEPHGVSRVPLQLGPLHASKTRHRQISKRGLIHCTQAPTHLQTQVFILAQPKPCQSSKPSQNQPRGLQTTHPHLNMVHHNVEVVPSPCTPPKEEPQKQNKSCCRKQKHKEISHYISNGSRSPLPPCLSSSARMFPSIRQFTPGSSKKILHNLKFHYFVSWFSDQLKHDGKTKYDKVRDEMPSRIESEDEVAPYTDSVRCGQLSDESETDEDQPEQPLAQNLAFQSFNCQFESYQTNLPQNLPQKSTISSPVFYNTNHLNESCITYSSSDFSNTPSLPSSSHHSSTTPSISSFHVRKSRSFISVV